jgi:hypothetical protein
MLSLSSSSYTRTRRCVDHHLTKQIQKERLVKKLQQLGEDVDGTESIEYCCRCAKLLGFDPEPFLDREKVVYWY